LYSQGPVYLQSRKVGITLQDNAVFLGPSNNSQATQPLLLGNDTKTLLSDLITSLSTFSSALINAKSSPEGTTITDLAMAAEALQISLKTYGDLLDNKNYLLSQTTYTS
jgi:hypothetical protein